MEILKKNKEFDDANINEDSLLIADVGLDSLDFFSIIEELEEKYGVVVDDSQLESIKTVKDLMNLLD